MQLTIQRPVFPKGSSRVAQEAQLHHAADRGNHDCLHAAVLDLKSIHPAVIGNVLDPHARLLTGRQALQLRGCGAVLQPTEPFLLLLQGFGVRQT